MINKKTHVLVKINKKKLNIIKLMIKIKLIFFAKKISKNLILIKINNNFKLNIKNLFKKKKTIVNKKSKILKNTILIVSNSNGFSIRNNGSNKNGLVFLKLNF
jgi:hypothetical protein